MPRSRNARAPLRAAPSGDGCSAQCQRDARFIFVTSEKHSVTTLGDLATDHGNLHRVLGQAFRYEAIFF